MSRVFFREQLECVAIFWRIARRDGVVLGFTSHDRDLFFDGILHRSAPGITPSSIRRHADLTMDAAEMQGVLTHSTISEQDCAQGRYDGAQILVGLVDWENREDTALLYRGEIGAISMENGRFNAELRSAKAQLDRDPIPRTSPTCRASFCGPGCTLSAARFTHEARLAAIDPTENRVTFTGAPALDRMAGGSLCWLDGPQAGLRMEVIEAGAAGLMLDKAISESIMPGTRALLREGCDHRLETCHQRFTNAANFQGEPFLPGNDAITRYPTSSSA
ncbi:DUF2163 domain-containing protein [Altericroceibacterium spongiae]|uniref:DUF2163 domain-containing protein n=1 Tax=Altericroceibacterium spongiae TaxID=2320269 RepID=A0A420EIP4_9SPHN|nr:DUF2163 domain-containing protein [Altericroceibacterium spongiae]RKF20575.1 DUF2163 domain-containing protein [Altericroceibacterium spongiae]